MSGTKLVCEVESCDNELSPGTGSQGGLMICHRCRSSQYYWRKAGPDAMVERRDRLTLWTDRLEYLSPHIGRMIRAAKNRVAAARARVSTSTRH